MKRLFLSWAILACLFGFSGPTKNDALGLTPLINYMSLPGVQVTVVWQDCGQPNAFYWGKERRVIMCNELLDVYKSGQIRFYLAHEIGHAIIHQLKVPHPGSQEVAADEIAAWVLIGLGQNSAVMDTAQFFWDRHAAMPLGAVHPDDDDRALYLACFAQRIKDDPEICPRTYEDIAWTWTELLLKK